jgi:hypothetical protein
MSIHGAARARHAGSEAARDTLELADSTPFRWAVRIGFGARGLTYALIGAIAIALASGAGSSASPDQQGALELVARAPLGGVILAVAAVGLAAYAVWKLVLAALGTGPEGADGHGAMDRLSNLAGGVVYLGFCALAVRVLAGSGGNQTRSQRHTTAGVLGWPAGRELVAGAGVVLVAISLQQAYVALRGEFAHHSKTGEMGPEERRIFMILGRVGLTARALVFGLSGYFLIRTAIDFKVSRGLGVDGSLSEVHAQTYGNVLLVLVGVGLLLFAVFSLLEARRRRL